MFFSFEVFFEVIIFVKFDIIDDIMKCYWFVNIYVEVFYMFEIRNNLMLFLKCLIN